MKSRLEDKLAAISLRKQGLSYKEIMEKIPVSKGLLSGWLKFLDLSPEEELFLKERMKTRRDGARLRAAFTNRTRRIEREKVAMSDAKEVFKRNFEDQAFLIGVTLYWAEGGKRVSEFNFINSDPDMIIFMDKWIKKYLQIPKEKMRYRLFLHRIPGHESLEAFWSKKLGIEVKDLQKTIYKPTIHAIKKNPEYKGCCRIGFGGMYHLRLMKAWQKLLIQYYGGCV